MIVGLCQPRFIFVAKTDVECEFAGHAEIILNVARVITDEVIKLRAGYDGTRRGVAHQEVGKIGSGAIGRGWVLTAEYAIEGEVTARVCQRSKVRVDLAEIEACGDIVPTDIFRYRGAKILRVEYRDGGRRGTEGVVQKRDGGEILRLD